MWISFSICECFSQEIQQVQIMFSHRMYVCGARMTTAAHAGGCLSVDWLALDVDL